MGYQPPFINATKFKELFPGRMNYYKVDIRKLYTGDIEISLTNGDYVVILTCIKEK